MAILHPFRAVRPRPERAKDVASVPYDVINTAEARDLADGNPHSFLHVIRPEIDLPEGTDEHADEVYAKGAANLRAWVESKATVREEAPSVYVYKLVMGERAQTGLFACVAVQDYDDDVILKHELTRPVKEDDRTRHILEQQAHAEPVMLTYRGEEAINAVVAKTMDTPPLYDFQADDGVQHTVWRVAEPGTLVEAFADVAHLYVADGHHRCKAASRVAEVLRGRDAAGAEYAFFPAVLFPMEEMLIMPYNRLIYRLPSSPSDFLATLRDHFDVASDAPPNPARPGAISIYLDGAWYGLTLPATKESGVAATLDVARLGEHLLEPLLGISNPRTDPNIDFVGGIRGTAELEQRVDRGQAQMAISMFATSIQELVEVSDAGQLMPPKSTWFEPKLRSGLLVHTF